MLCIALAICLFFLSSHTRTHENAEAHQAGTPAWANGGGYDDDLLWRYSVGVMPISILKTREK